MSDLDLLLQWKAWETQAFGSVFGVALSAVDLLYVPEEEFIDAFLDSWRSAKLVTKRANYLASYTSFDDDAEPS